MQAININNKYTAQPQAKAQSFKSLADGFLKMQENLSYTRFVQDTATNWVPKATFTRSKADLAEMSFLEFIESALFYFAPGILGALISKGLTSSKAISKLIPQDTPEHLVKGLKTTLNKGLAQNVDEILTNKTLVEGGYAKKLLPLKAAIVLGCVGIPAAEYALSFAKNLFTLKVFKKADFNNIANLNKDQKEDEKLQKKVETSAKSHIKKAAIVSGAALVTGFIFAALGHKSNKLQKASEYILQPGAKISNGLEKLGVNSKKLQNFLKTYINFDFDFSGGKFALSKGQLAATVISGVFGYHAAAKDRGKLDELEMLTRVPLVAFYTIFGSSLFEKGFKYILHKTHKFTDLIQKEAGEFVKLPTRAELPVLAETIAKARKTLPEAELKRLTKEKAVISAVPFGFSLVFMGFLLSAISRFWTQYRYNKTHNQPHNLQEVYNSFTHNKKNNSTFKCFN